MICTCTNKLNYASHEFYSDNNSIELIIIIVSLIIIQPNLSGCIDIKQQQKVQNKTNKQHKKKQRKKKAMGRRIYNYTILLANNTDSYILTCSKHLNAIAVRVADIQESILVSADPIWVPQFSFSTAPPAK